MNHLITIATLMTAVVVSGCASTQSIVTSTKSSPDKIEEGIVYSLPKQLVKVVYVRKAIDSSEAAIARKKAKEAVNVTTKEIKEKKKLVKELADLIKNIDPQAINKVALETKLNLDLTKLKAELLGLTKLLAQQNSDFAVADTDYARSLKSDKAFSETLEITPESPIPDTSNTYYARIKHQGTYSDTLELKTKNGLLDGAIGHSEDKTGEIIVSLAGGLSGLIQPSFLGIGVTKTFTFATPPEPTACIKEPAISISQVIDPNNSTDLAALNTHLHDGCIKVSIDPPDTAQTTALNNFPKANGLIYRQPGSYIFRIKNVDDEVELQSIQLNLSQGGQVGVIPMPKGSFAKNEYDVAFINGMLSKSTVIQPSEVLGFAMILPNALREIFAIPTELIRLKVDYSSSEKELIELKKAMLEAQVDIEKKQLALEGMAISNSPE